MTNLRTHTGSGLRRLSLAAIVLGWFCVATVIAASAQGLVFTTLTSFNGTNGANPLLMSLVQGTDGNFYGTTQQGGANNSCQGGCGTVFKITSAGVLTSLYSFCSQPNCTDGSAPYAGLVQGTEGNFYGTTYAGGANNVGTVFQITPAGALTTLHSFAGPDGANPWAPLTRANDGVFYGTTIVGGTNSLGTVFKITSSGALTTLYSFQGGSDAANPVSGLVQARDGNFYGTTLQGSSWVHCAVGYSCGTIFQITPAGELTSLYSFCSQSNCPDGNQPYGGLVQASDGNFYGTTYGGGDYEYNDCQNNGCGTVFKFTPSGALTTLYLFDSRDGSDPTGTLVQARDGNLYGTSSGDGNWWYGYATVFRITGSGALTTLHLFDSEPDYTPDPYGGLVQAADGSFYGTTYAGGDYGFGTVFRLGYSASVRPCAVCRQ